MVEGSSMSGQFCGDDIAVWADGSWATLDDIRRGEFDWKSDDYEIVPYDDTTRLIALDVIDEGDP